MHSFPPNLLGDYLHYCSIKNSGEKVGTIDLKEIGWIYPSTLLPIVLYLKSRNLKDFFIKPKKKFVADYIDRVLNGNMVRGHSSFPMVTLPTDVKRSGSILQDIYSFCDEGKECGGTLAFKYIVGEITTNIYEHSSFSTALVMAQKYPTKGFMDICFVDNGITIAGSFKKVGMLFEDYEAIDAAIRGTSSKMNLERGYGLITNINMLAQGYGGSVLIVSGCGAYFYHGNPKGYKLRESTKFDGTLVSMRVPYPSKEVNLYEYTG